MGFYLTLEKCEATDFHETSVPPIFWVLYFIAGFALICMGASAFFLLWDLAEKGSSFDRFIVLFIVAMVPLYVLIGIKLAWIRKFVKFKGSALQVGFECLGHAVFRRTLERSNIAEVSLINKRPSENLAKREHTDSQYYIRGHWRVEAKLRNGRSVTLDRHTEKEALTTLYHDAKIWLNR